ncbi:MAG: 6-phosphogluconolactonase [Porphyromonas sp.]|nr:6-phosphogluconolactonase [Porphyromonas sp.]
MIMFNLHRYASAQSVAEAITDLLKKKYLEHKAHNPSEPYTVALSGGSTPLSLLYYWKEREEIIQEMDIHFFWVDERMVPYESKESNYGEATRAFFDCSGISQDRLHPINSSMQTVESAQEYAEQLSRFSKKYQKKKAIDFLILGIGDDGHTSSLFPGQEKHYSEEKLFISSINHTKVERVALSMYGILHEADTILFHLLGEKKKDILQEVLNSTIAPQKETLLPSAYVIAHASKPVDIFTDIPM